MDENVRGLEVSVVLSQPMNQSDPGDEGLGSVQRLESRKTPLRLAVKENRQRFKIAVVRYKEGQKASVELCVCDVVIGRDNRHTRELRKPPLETPQTATIRISLGVIELQRPVDARPTLDDMVDFGFGSTTETPNHCVLSENGSRRQHLDPSATRHGLSYPNLRRTATGLAVHAVCSRNLTRVQQYCLIE